MNDAAIPEPSRPVEVVHPTAPASGETIEIAPGLLWARVPLPYRLNHVNIWLLDDGDGWTAIDTGSNTTGAREGWDLLAGGILAGKPVRRLFATHGHTDHVGLASWLTERFNCSFTTTQVEWLSPQLRRAESMADDTPHVARFLALHGCNEATIAAYREERRRIQLHLMALPPVYQRIRDGEQVRAGGRTWQVITAGGHAAEHASFWCEEDAILIVGDQVLQKISPMIGVFPNEPDADPLAEYLASLPRFAGLPEQTLVLPGHGLPFRGLGTRTWELAHHHRERLATLRGLLAGRAAKTGMELTAGLFERAVAEGQGRHALSETLAHVHYLVGTGEVQGALEADGRLRFAMAR
jgi:glyoxylase-like metal-dependent hydrolase (beta-lactamase superfamily II)